MNTGEALRDVPGHIDFLLRVTGRNIDMARRRQRLRASDVALRAEISRSTYHRMVRGEPVGTDKMFRVLVVLGMGEELTKVALEDPRGRSMQDREISKLKRVRR